MLALEIPLSHWNDFIQEEDFHYALTHLILSNKEYREKYQQLRKSLPLDKELWLDNSFNELHYSASIEDILKAIDYIEPTHVVGLEEYDPKENIKATVYSKNEFSKRGLNVKLVSCWRGTKYDLNLLQSISDVVALPYDSLRSTPCSKWGCDSRNYHYFGFKNLDELRCYPPRSLDTSAPIRAAMLGIDLSERERRPKNLPLFSLYMKLTKEQVTLAKSNIKAIKKAMKGE
jgi:hypothetical protein